VIDETEYSLHDVEPTPIFDTLDISSTTNRPEVLSEEFGDFMELVTKWNLSDACANDILKFRVRFAVMTSNYPPQQSKRVNYWIESMCRIFLLRKCIS